MIQYSYHQLKLKLKIRIADLSGPVEMISAFKNGLKDTGINDTKIHIDEWE